MMDLETQTTRRLEAAGIAHDDPALIYIRAWNARVCARRDAREQWSDSRSDHRGRGADRGSNSPGSPVAPRKRPRPRYAPGTRRAGLRHA